MRKISALIVAVLIVVLTSCSSYSCPTYAKAEQPKSSTVNPI
ncbi:MAG: lipoprotein [Flammeovirgaceae bacterium]|nr:lipoprotein [Flammeovirgaceae bacterium]